MTKSDKMFALLDATTWTSWTFSTSSTSSCASSSAICPSSSGWSSWWAGAWALCPASTTTKRPSSPHRRRPPPLSACSSCSYHRPGRHLGRNLRAWWSRARLGAPPAPRRRPPRLTGCPRASLTSSRSCWPASGWRCSSDHRPTEWPTAPALKAPAAATEPTARLRLTAMEWHEKWKKSIEIHIEIEYIE